jgi:hypothetical protein
LNYTKASANYFSGGMMLGFTGSQVDGDTYSGYNKLGLTGGIFVSRKFNDIWSMQAELKYIMKGAAKTTSATDPSIDILGLHYFELPLLCKVKTTKKIEVESGLAEAYLFYATKNDGYGPIKPIYPINKTDLSWIAGISYLYSEKFTFNLKFSYSLLRISYVAMNLTTWGTYGQYNHLLDFAVFYTFK